MFVQKLTVWAFNTCTESMDFKMKFLPCLYIRALCSCATPLKNVLVTNAGVTATPGLGKNTFRKRVFYQWTMLQ